MHRILGGPSLLKSKGVWRCNDPFHVATNSVDGYVIDNSRIRVVADKHNVKGILQNKVLLNARLNPVSALDTALSLVVVIITVDVRQQLILFRITHIVCSGQLWRSDWILLEKLLQYYRMPFFLNSIDRILHKGMLLIIPSNHNKLPSTHAHSLSSPHLDSDIAPRTPQRQTTTIPSSEGREGLCSTRSLSHPESSLPRTDSSPLPSRSAKCPATTRHSSDTSSPQTLQAPCSVSFQTRPLRLRAVQLSSQFVVTHLHHTLFVQKHTVWLDVLRLTLPHIPYTMNGELVVKTPQSQQYTTRHFTNYFFIHLDPRTQNGRN